MAYTRVQSIKALSLVQNMLLQDADQVIPIATIVADTDLQALMSVPAELTAFLTSREGKELNLVGGAKAEATVTVALNAAGDGVVGFTIRGVTYSYTPAAAATPTIIAEALVAQINAIGIEYKATNALGVITITATAIGTSWNGETITDVTTDTTTTVTVTAAFAGGLDLDAYQLASSNARFNGTSAGVA